MTTKDKISVLLIEDETLFATAIQKRLRRESIDSWIVSDLKSARAYIADVSVGLILLDLRLPDGSGLDFLQEFYKEHNDTPVIVMSAYGEIDDAVNAMKCGAVDYLKKPVSLEELVIVVKKIFQSNQLKNKLAFSKIREKHAQRENSDALRLLGNAPSMVALKKEITKIVNLVATQDPPTLLLLGETGVGKDLVARFIHTKSKRASSPYVHVDCTALPANLIEAELFGHVRGAFTDARTERPGLFMAAEDGVIFLDEIGELPLDLQSKFLSVLERRKVRKVGGTEETDVKAWTLVATNRNLETMVDDGKFRSDLFYRLNVLRLIIPPLRQRQDDIGLLAQHFADITAQRYQLKAPQFSEQARHQLESYTWPGNVRELKHLMERMVLLNAETGVIDAIPVIHPSPAKQPSLKDQEDTLPLNVSHMVHEHGTLEDIEKKLILQTLAGNRGNISAAARQLGITRMAMRYRMKKHGVFNTPVSQDQDL